MSGDGLRVEGKGLGDVGSVLLLCGREEEDFAKIRRAIEMKDNRVQSILLRIRSAR